MEDLQRLPPLPHLRLSLLPSPLPLFQVPPQSKRSLVHLARTRAVLMPIGHYGVEGLQRQPLLPPPLPLAQMPLQSKRSLLPLALTRAALMPTEA